MHLVNIFTLYLQCKYLYIYLCKYRLHLDAFIHGLSVYPLYLSVHAHMMVNVSKTEARSEEPRYAFADSMLCFIRFLNYEPGFGFLC